MILGTRACPRHERMKRTTSMSEISYDDISILNNTQPSDQFQNPFAAEQQQTVDIDRKTLLGMVSPRLLLNRRNSADFAAKSSNNSTFLRTCSLCRRRLTSGRDIFMYKGDTAYCSLECRQQQMAQDEWKEKCKKGSSSSSSSSTNKEPLSSNKGETVAVL